MPWTVNKKEEMEKVISYGVDGLISDYPNRYFELKK
ncbi:glycerophosphodiester phosphodiesterase family protein [Flavobacterium davisii]|nr:glycerophosphodiester phosphodiesterase family protein [Flavobacterium davisii]